MLIAELYKVRPPAQRQLNRQHMGQRFELLWSSDQRRHTIHGSDLASACVALAQWIAPLGRQKADAIAGSPLSPCRPLPGWVPFGSKGSASHGLDQTEIEGLAPRTATMTACLFNCVDDGDTRAGSYNQLIATVVGAEFGRVTPLISAYARSQCVQLRLYSMSALPCLQPAGLSPGMQA